MEHCLASAEILEMVIVLAKASTQICSYILCYFRNAICPHPFLRKVAYQFPSRRLILQEIICEIRKPIIKNEPSTKNVMNLFQWCISVYTFGFNQN